MKPIRYDEAEVKKYTEKGWWTEELCRIFGIEMPRNTLIAKPWLIHWGAG